MTALLAPPPERVTAHARAHVPRDHPAVAIYEGTVRHRRFTPTLREFAPKLFLAYLDVDALPGSLDRLPLWSARRPAPVRFRPRDFLDGTDRPLGAAVRDLVQARLGRRPTGPVHLLAQLRTFGWLFNPLADYYCWTPDGLGSRRDAAGPPSRERRRRDGRTRTRQSACGGRSRRGGSA